MRYDMSACTIFNQDCISGIREKLVPGSVNLTVTSIPFEELFTYSGKLEDVGNNGSTIDIRAGRFALNLRFVVDSLMHAHAPGTVCCIHVQQLLAYKNQHGHMGRRHFTAAVVDVFAAGGFVWVGEFIIPKNPQAMAQRLSLHSLMFITGRRDAQQLAPAPNDYVLVFRKPGECEHPVKSLHDEQKNPSGWVQTDEWVRDAAGVWDDVIETDVLDGVRSARESTDEKHVCPLQLEVIRRLVRLYSNPISIQPDVLVLDPFSGIGSTGYVCLGGATQQGLRVEEPRNYVGFELKESYYQQSLKNVDKLKRRQKREQVAGKLF